ncbi:MAG: NlpC/P60 family protein [Thermoleophilia bacterium]|nr:NlpC/P60 family protein [Thermoleophilia bacterium]
MFLFLGFAIGGVAQAEPPAITKAKNEAEALREQIDELNQKLDALVEDYNYARAKLAETKSAIEATQKQLSKAEADLNTAVGALEERLVAIYKQGRPTFLDVLLNASSFSELVSNIELLERLSAQDVEIIKQVQSYRARVAEEKAALAERLEEEQKLAAQVKVARAKVEEQIAATEKALAGKEAQIAKLEKEEAERQARLAAEAKKRAEEARKKAEEERKKKEAAQKAAQAKKSSQVSTKEAVKEGVSKTASVSVPEGASASDVVSIALKYLGCPYVWGGASPSGFDCSGFVMYVYKQVGISLPHSSRMQYSCGRPVSRSELRPGDLVFFYDPISHVGIYIGNGEMVHAAGRGKDVRITEVWTKSYYGACRIIE